jgi:uncharacterized cupredoxin-like copper-binding protein
MKSVLTVVSALLLGALTFAALAHEGEHFSAGEPGNPKQPARIVTITMRDDEGKMRFEPASLTVRKGEQVRFLISNDGALKHEFTLASVQDNNKHAELMKKYPDMEHDDPNAKSVDPGKGAEILWRFTKPGDFEFACLIPGHREAGMHGVIHVK